MKQAYVVDTGGENYIIMIANHVPRGSIGLSPMSEGKQVVDIDWLDIVDAPDGLGGTVKSPVVNPTKKQNKVSAQTTESNKKIAEAADKATLAKHVARMDFGKELKARVSVINASKNWNDATWASFRTNAGVGQLSALLLDGYLKTAKDLLSSLDLSIYYTVEEKQGIIDRITDYLANE